MEYCKEAYDNAIGYRSEEIPLVKSQLSSNASDVLEGQDLGYILDGTPYTFWHSDWHNQVSETHYLQVSLEEPIGNDIAIYMKRRFIEQHHLTRLGCHCSNDGTNWTEIGEFHLDNAYYGAEVMSNPLWAIIRTNTSGYIFWKIPTDLNSDISPSSACCKLKYWERASTDCLSLWSTTCMPN